MLTATDSTALHELASQLRVVSILTSTAARSGHPSSSMSAADLMAVLLTGFRRSGAPACSRGHTRLAHRSGATDGQTMEAIWVAAERCAGGACAHSTLALDVLDKQVTHDSAS